MKRVITSIAVLLVLCVAVGIAQGPPDRTHPPVVGPPPALHLPQIQKRTLSNGIAVWVVESHEVPLVQVDLVVLAGSDDDPAGKFGEASLTADMMDEGAGGRSALQIADAIDFLGAELSTTSTFDYSAVRLNVPVARLEAALPVMADVAIRPTFPAQELERIRQERLTALLQARDDPASVASLAFARVVFGPTHRYGTAAIGTVDTLKAFTTGDLAAFHAARYQPSHVALVVAGDITADSVLPQLEQQFGTWRKTTPVNRTPVPPAMQLTSSTITIVDVPGAAQSQIRIGWVGAARSTPDYFTLQVLNTILGGSFSSRLNQNLREEHGYTYGASSRFDMRLSPGPFFAAAGVQTDKTAESLREFFKELNGIDEPVPQDELKRAKNYVAFGFPGEFETIEDLAGRIEEMIVYNLPDGYFEQYVPRIEAVTVADVQKAAATYIQPSRFAIVVAGDRKTIEAPIKALGLAPVRVLTVEDALGPAPVQPAVSLLVFGRW